MRRELNRIVVRGHQFYLLSEWRDRDEEGLDLLLAGDGETWKGQVVAEELQRSARELNMDLVEYAAETRHALCGTGESSSYDFSVQKIGTGRLELVWKKNIPEDTIKYQLGSSVLQLCTQHNDMLSRMFDFAIDKMRELKDCITDLEKDNTRLSNERAAVLERLENCVEQKDALELELFGKFKVLINSKKAKIRQLKQQVEDVRTAAAASQAAPSGTGNAALASAGAASDEERGTDEMDCSDSQPSGEGKRASRRSAPRTKQSAPMSSDNLLDDDDAPVVPLAKRRRRPESISSGKIPLPPSLPQPDLTRTDSSSSVKRHRMRRKISDIDDEDKRARMLEEL